MIKKIDGKKTKRLTVTWDGNIIGKNVTVTYWVISHFKSCKVLGNYQKEYCLETCFSK